MGIFTNLIIGAGVALYNMQKVIDEDKREYGKNIQFFKDEDEEMHQVKIKDVNNLNDPENFDQITFNILKEDISFNPDSLDSFYSEGSQRVNNYKKEKIDEHIIKYSWEEDNGSPAGLCIEHYYYLNKRYSIEYIYNSGSIGYNRITLLKTYIPEVKEHYKLNYSKSELLLKRKSIISNEKSEV